MLAAANGKRAPDGLRREDHPQPAAEAGEVVVEVDDMIATRHTVAVRFPDRGC